MAVTAGNVVRIEPVERNSDEDLFNRADPHCEACEGRGLLAADLICPCVTPIATSTGAPDRRRRGQRRKTQQRETCRHCGRWLRADHSCPGPAAEHPQTYHSAPFLKKYGG
jgi:ribosomal protein L32